MIAAPRRPAAFPAPMARNDRQTTIRHNTQTGPKMKRNSSVTVWELMSLPSGADVPSCRRRPTSHRRGDGDMIPPHQMNARRPDATKNTTVDGPTLRYRSSLGPGFHPRYFRTKPACIECRVASSPRTCYEKREADRGSSGWPRRRAVGSDGPAASPRVESLRWF